MIEEGERQKEDGESGLGRQREVKAIQEIERRRNEKRRVETREKLEQ